MFSIKPYFIYDIETGTVLQNGISTVIINNAHLVEFLKNVESKKQRVISPEEIKSTFGEAFQKVLDFLLDNSIIQKQNVPALKYEKIILLHNNQAFATLFKNIITPTYSNFETINISDSFDINKNDTLYVFFMNPFSIKEYISICDHFEQNDVVYKTCFFYNHSLYVSNFHKHSWYNPCPKCFFYSLEAHLRGGRFSDSINFQTLIDIIYEQTERFPIQADLTPLNYIAVIKLMSEQMLCSKDFNKIYNQVFEYQICDSKLNTDYAYYWEICDCYE
jgi:McbB family protein